MAMNWRALDLLVNARRRTPSKSWDLKARFTILLLLNATSASLSWHHSKSAIFTVLEMLLEFILLESRRHVVNFVRCMVP